LNYNLDLLYFIPKSFKLPSSNLPFSKQWIVGVITAEKYEKEVSFHWMEAIIL